MAMDGLALRAVVTELQTLVGAKIDKVQQPEKDTLLLTLRGAGCTSRLLVVTHGENGRIQLTEGAFDNPATAPAFCMLLRRHLLGGRVTAFTQDGPDRACTLHIQARNELMDDVRLRLVVELMGKHSNVILVGGDGIILDCLRHISPSETTLRILLPGFPYEKPPAQNKVDPLEADLQTLNGIYASPSPQRAMTDAMEGIGRSTAGALLDACQTPEALEPLFSQLRAGNFSPALIYYAGEEPGLALPFRSSQVGCRTVEEASMSAALDHFYAQRDVAVRMRRHGASLRRAVENALSRAENKQKTYLEAIQNGEQLEENRIAGELILANLSQIRPGQTVLKGTNYYLDPPVETSVSLDGALSGQENAKRYFKLYRKGKVAKEYALCRIDEVTGEINYLQGVLSSLSECDTLSELEEIREELIGGKYLKPEKKRQKQQYANPSQPMRFVASDGTPVSVGKNNRQNEWLTLRQARPEHYFFHAKNMPGSHVILFCQEEPDEKTLMEAATLAAFYSSGRASTTVAVDYTRRKNVKKPAGGRPGMVIYSTNKTLYVYPDPALVRVLKANADADAQH